MVPGTDARFQFIFLRLTRYHRPGKWPVSPSKAETFESGSVDAPRLMETATRLKEVRRRYVSDSGDEEKFALAEGRLDSIISDLDRWLKPGGDPIEIADLELQLAAVEEMIESVGFPAYARVIASVRENLLESAEDSSGEEESPPVQRYEDLAASVGTPSTSEADLDEWEIRAAAEKRQRGWGWLVWSILICGVLAAAALPFFWRGKVGSSPPDRVDRVNIDQPEVLEPTAAPAPTWILDSTDTEESEELRAETQAQIAREIDLAHDALSAEDLDPALQHLANAAAIDRHDWRVSALAGSLIESLLKQADVAFDNSDWERAADRVEIARRIARGLYFDASAIDETAQKHAAMTRFEDVTPEDGPALSRAVGHAVRVTQTDGEVLLGRLEAFEDNTLLLEVLSGVEGGGVQFSKTIPLVMIRELRVFDVERPSEIVLAP